MQNDRKGVLGLDTVKIFIIVILMVSVVAFVGIILLVSLQDIREVTVIGNPFIEETMLGDNATAIILSPTPDSGTVSATNKNRTWLDFDGNNDFVYFSDNSYETISFWYKNDLVDWQHLVNTSDILYTNGSEVADFQIYPLIHNGSDYILGKTDDSTFFEGSIDDIRFYNDTINESIVDTIFNAGR